MNTDERLAEMISEIIKAGWSWEKFKERAADLWVESLEEEASLMRVKIAKNEI